MKIPRNFDRWMFDYKEGNLSQSEMAYFEKHMADNPQLDVDISAWDNAYIRKESITYSGMTSLQRHRQFGLGLRWIASMIVVIAASFSIYYFSNSKNKLYSLRESGLQNISYDSYSPYLINNKSSLIDMINTESDTENSTDDFYTLNENINVSNSFTPLNI